MNSPSFPSSLAVGVDLTAAVSSCPLDFTQAPRDGCSDSHNWAFFHNGLGLASQAVRAGGGQEWLWWCWSRFSCWDDRQSAEGSGFDLSSCKAVILEENAAGGGEATVLAGKSFWRKQMFFGFFSFPPIHFLQTFHFRTSCIFPFQRCRVACVMLRETSPENGDDVFCIHSDYWYWCFCK